MRKVNKAVWADRRDVLRRLSESGVSAAEFCRGEGIPYGRLMVWRRRIRLMDHGLALAGGGAVEAEVKPAFAELVVRGMVFRLIRSRHGLGAPGVESPPYIA